MKYLKLILLVSGLGSLFLSSEASGVSGKKNLSSDSEFSDIYHGRDGFKCPFPFGSFSDPEDCAHFYICVAGKGMHKKCPPFHHFCVWRRVCLPKFVAICGNNKDKITDTPPVTTETPKPEENCKCSNWRGSFPYPNDCSKYCTCTIFIPKLKTCPENQLFDAEKKSCEPESEVDCGTRQRPGHTTTAVSTETITETSKVISTEEDITETTTEEISTEDDITETTTEEISTEEDITETTTEEISTEEDIAETTTEEISTEEDITETTTEEISTQEDISETTTEEISTEEDITETMTEKISTEEDITETTTEEITTEEDITETKTEETSTEEEITETLTEEISTEDNITEEIITESTTESTTEIISTTRLRPTGPPEHNCDEDDVDCIITETGDVEDWFICPRVMGVFPHESSNKLFILCLDWIPVVKKCGLNRVFSTERSTCTETEASIL